ncbi:MAG: arsenite permease [Leptospiraceae bacterium]|nr:MAG: arsenite permease [Leptospiraceae bacterium]
MKFPFSIIILLVVFFFITFRRWGRIQFKIYQIMTLGALLSIATFQISVKEAIQSINYEIILFLIGMFIVGEALYKSGYLAKIAYHFFNKANNTDKLLIYIIYLMGFLSAILMNDTIAIIGTMVVLYFSKEHKIPAKILLLSLAYSITIGSVASPIGNPQNLVIATSTYFTNPFINFIKYLFIPTVINLFIVYLIIKFFYKEYFTTIPIVHTEPEIKDVKLAKLSKYSLWIIILLILIKILIYIINFPFNFDLVYIALLSSLVIVLFSERRWELIKSIDWHTIIFFISMFILMQSVWNSNFFQKYINQLNIHSLPVIFLIGLILSQFISNVPLVVLFLSFLETKPDIVEMIVLACSSTIAGNLTVLGAASNVIIIQNAEKHNEHISTLEFTKIGMILTIINSLIYYGYIYLIKLI